MTNLFRLHRWIVKAAQGVVFTVCLCIAVSASAFDYSSGDDETILIEKPISFKSQSALKSASDLKFSYSAAIKAFSKSILQFDVDAFLSGGQNCKDAVIRNLSQLSERTRYRLNLKQEKVEVKFTLNF